MDDAWSLLWLLGQSACAIALIAGAALASSGVSQRAGTAPVLKC